MKNEMMLGAKLKEWIELKDLDEPGERKAEAGEDRTGGLIQIWAPP